MSKVEFQRVATSRGIIRIESGASFAASLALACCCRIENHFGKIIVVEFLMENASLRSYEQEEKVRCYAVIDIRFNLRLNLL